MKEPTVLYDGLYERIKNSLLKNKDNFLRTIARYIDKNAENLFIVGPYKRILFLDENRKLVFDNIEMTEKEIKEVIKRCPLIEPTWMVLNDPFNIAMVMIISFFEEIKDQKGINLSIMYMTLRFYSSILYNMFKYGADEKIMIYTINNLSEKYTIKTEQNMYNALLKIAQSNHEHIAKDITLKHEDKSVKYYVTNLNTKIRGMLKNINEKYRENHANKSYMNVDLDRYDDDENKLRDLSNVSTNIAQVLSKVYLKIKSIPVDEKILRYACDRTKISFYSVKSTLASVFDTEKERLKELLTCILQLYLSNPKNKKDTIKSKQFYIYCRDIYSISNTKDNLVLKIKEILNQWMEDYSKEYAKTNREATKINFKKTLYLYIVLFITVHA